MSAGGVYRPRHRDPRRARDRRRKHDGPAPPHPYPPPQQRRSSFPDGSATGGTWLGFEINGWTNFFTAAAGGLLLFGAAQHLLAKTMSLLVGLALGASAAIALIDGDVLGLAAANGWTELGWGIVAAVLLVNTLLPRTGRRVAEPAVVHDDRTRDDDAVAPAPLPAAQRARDPDGDRVGDPATTHGDRVAGTATPHPQPGHWSSL